MFSAIHQVKKRVGKQNEKTFSCFLFFLAASAFTQTSEGECREYSLNIDGPYQSDKEAICREAARKCDSSPYYSCDYLDSSGGYCSYSNYTEDRSFRYSNTVIPFFSRKCEENKCSAKKGQKHGDGTASATVTGKENVDRLLSRGKGPISLCQDGCVIKGSFSVGVCEETSCTFGVEGVTYTGGQCKGGGVSLDEEQSQPETPKPPEEQPKPKPEEPFTCPDGKCPGEVNGQQVCVPCGDSAAPTPPKPPASSASDAVGSGNGKGDGKGDAQGNGNGNGTGSGGAGGGGGGGGGKGSGSSDSTGQKQGEREGEDGSPPQYGERPELYEPKYKDGVKGVWDEKKGQLKDTKLANLAKKLMPTEKRGNCPSWTFDLNFGRGLGFGTHRLQPPCTIWPMLRAIVIVCALILARKLVFGG